MHQVFVRPYSPNSHGYIFRSRINELLVTLCLTFEGTTKLSSKEATSFYKPTSSVGRFSSPGPHQYVLLSVFSITAATMAVSWYFITFLTSISLRTRDGRLFKCLLAICISSLKKWLFKYFAHF